MSKASKKKKLKIFNIFIFLIVILGGSYLIYFGINNSGKINNNAKTYYLSSNITTVNTYDENFNVINTLTK